MTGGNNEIFDSTASGNGGIGMVSLGGSSFVQDAKTPEEHERRPVHVGTAGNHATDVQASGNGAEGIQLEGGSNQVALSKATKNAGTGIDLSAGQQQHPHPQPGQVRTAAPAPISPAPATCSALKASGNDGGNLVTTGTCTELANKAP